MLSYLKFLLKSTNHHGVHSPFVYHYLTQCLYAKPQLSKNKIENILLKSISYFQYENVQIEDEFIKIRIGNQQNRLNFDGSPLDLSVIKRFNLQVVLEMIALEKMHNDTMLVIQDLKNNRAEWNRAVAHPKITISIDAFFLGLLFIRKEQVKEHFTIRL